MFAVAFRRATRARRAVSALTVGVLVASVAVINASAANAATSARRASTAGLVVATNDGPVMGKTTGTTDEFLGLPYAAPPVGALRWRAPQPAVRWRGVRDATEFAPHCAQSASPFGSASTSEDCLYLNVFTPAQQTWRAPRHLPVMVWIHGGALVTGESDDYNPIQLVRDGVIVVTINYRLGALGFLAHPALAGVPGGPSGDYGLMDQQAALRWVQRNIDNFGGDSHNVTIFGESAGGLSVASQLVSPGARGLFDRAVIESGAYALNTASLTTAEAAGEAFATQAGCADQTAACLRSLPVQTILANENAAGYQPDVDGQVLTESLGPALASGRFNHVPVVNGSNHDEWRLFVALSALEGAPVTAANYVSMISSTLGVPAATAAIIAAQYPLSAYPSPSVALGAVGTDATFACPALTLDDSVSKYVPTYAYEFNDENAPELFLPPVGFPYGAAHASEIQYVFDLNVSAFPTPLSGPQQQLATGMKAYWTNVAKRGVPSGLGEPLWLRFDPTHQRMQSLVPPRPQLETDFAAEHNCGFWSLAG
ncbi:MAG TPA: carboxylesterase family protein [Mycobacterium sp.]|jgi:para-nitrobenzyl esterase|nr:carboxylesterase family protein [Mycobacterium sp.]